MFTYKASVFTNFVFANFLIIVPYLVPMVADQRTVSISTDFDVVLLYDQTDSMKSHTRDQIWDYTSEWIRNKTSNASGIRFAVVGCGQFVSGGLVKPILDFYGTSSVPSVIAVAKNLVKGDTVISAQNIALRRIREDFVNNIDGCVQSTVSRVFDEKKGDRPNATNVVFHFSDCSFSFNDNSTEANMTVMLSKSKFLFVCLRDLGPKQKGLPKADRISWRNMMSWVKSENLIFSFTNQSKNYLFERLNQFLNVLETVTDCKVNGTTETGCMERNGSCVNIVSPSIVLWPNPVELAKPCPVDNVVLCDQEKCCEKIPWTSKACCNGTHYYQRNLSNELWCKKINLEEDTNCTNACDDVTTATGSTESSTGGSTKGSTTAETSFTSSGATSSSKYLTKMSTVETVFTTALSSKHLTEKTTLKVSQISVEPNDSSFTPALKTNVSEMNYTTTLVANEPSEEKENTSSTVEEEEPGEVEKVEDVTKSGDSNKIFIIIGAVIGGMFLIVVIIIAVMVIRNRRKRLAKEKRKRERKAGVKKGAVSAKKGKKSVQVESADSKSNRDQKKIGLKVSFAADSMAKNVRLKVKPSGKTGKLRKGSVIKLNAKTLVTDSSSDVDSEKAIKINTKIEKSPNSSVIKLSKKTSVTVKKFQNNSQKGNKSQSVAKEKKR